MNKRTENISMLKKLAAGEIALKDFTSAKVYRFIQGSEGMYDQTQKKFITENEFSELERKYPNGIFIIACIIGKNHELQSIRNHV